MKLKTLLALAVAGAFAVPFAAQASASGDRIILAQAGGPAGTSSVGRGPTGGTPSPQSAGEPADPKDRAPGAGATGATSGATPMFSSLDKNGDGQISQAEWDAHYRSGSAASGGASTSPAPSGPGTKSQAGSGSDTATSAGTSGKGKAQ